MFGGGEYRPSWRPNSGRLLAPGKSSIGNADDKHQFRFSASKDTTSLDANCGVEGFWASVDGAAARPSQRAIKSYLSGAAAGVDDFGRRSTVALNWKGLAGRSPLDGTIPCCEPGVAAGRASRPPNVAPPSWAAETASSAARRGQARPQSATARLHVGFESGFESESAAAAGAGGDSTAVGRPPLRATAAPAQPRAAMARSYNSYAPVLGLPGAYEAVAFDASAHEARRAMQGMEQRIEGRALNHASHKDLKYFKKYHQVAIAPPAASAPRGPGRTAAFEHNLHVAPKPGTGFVPGTAPHGFESGTHGLEAARVEYVPRPNPPGRPITADAASGASHGALSVRHVASGPAVPDSNPAPPTRHRAAPSRDSASQTPAPHPLTQGVAAGQAWAGIPGAAVPIGPKPGPAPRPLPPKPPVMVSAGSVPPGAAIAAAVYGALQPAPPRPASAAVRISDPAPPRIVRGASGISEYKQRYVQTAEAKPSGPPMYMAVGGKFSPAFGGVRNSQGSIA